MNPAPGDAAAQRSAKWTMYDHADAPPIEKPVITIRLRSIGYALATDSIASRPSVSPANRLALV